MKSKLYLKQFAILLFYITNFYLVNMISRKIHTILYRAHKISWLIKNLCIRPSLAVVA